MNTPLFVRLGLSKDQVNAEARIKAFERAQLPSNSDPFNRRSSLAQFQSHAALACYLEGRVDECVTRAKNSIALWEEYFLGSWRESIPNAKSGGYWPREHWNYLPWVEAYRTSLLWCACCGDWNAAKRLSQYPSENTTDEVSERKSEAPWYQVLAAYFRGEPHQKAELNGSPEVESNVREGTFEWLIERGRSKRMKLLSGALGAIRSSDSASSQDAISQYLIYYRKNEFPRPDIEDKISVDGSIMVHLAEHHGLNITVPPSCADNVVRVCL